MEGSFEPVKYLGMGYLVPTGYAGAGYALVWLTGLGGYAHACSTNWQADVFLPVTTAEAIFWRSPSNVEKGLQRVLVKVDSNDQVNAVASKIRELNLREYSLVSLYEEIRRSVILIGLAIAGVACLALVVAALGITNTSDDQCPGADP